MKILSKLIAILFLLTTACFAQTPPQLDMFGNLTGVACPASASWINTTVSSGAITGSLTPQNISLTSIGTVAAGNWLTIDAGAAPVTVTAETPNGTTTLSTGTVSYPVTLKHGNYLPGSGVLLVNGVAVAYDQGALTSPPLAGKLQTGILVDAGLVTTGTSNNAMAISRGDSADTTPYENFLSVQNADPTAPSGGVADQEFINIVFQSAFVAAHNGQSITFTYKYSPSEFFVVPSVTGSQLNNVVLLNNHAANAPITQGTWYFAKVTVGSTPTWVQCDPLGFGNDQFALYAINQDSATSHMSDTVNTTVAASVATGTHTVTPVSMAGICDQCYLTFDQGTASEETQKVTVSGSTITATFANSHGANFTVQGYYYNAVAFGTCATSNANCQAPGAGASGGKYYGNIGFWGPMQIVRARGWGYNVVQAFNDTRVIPISTVSGGGTISWPTADHSNIAKMPFMITNDVTYYGSFNSSNFGAASGCGGTGDYAIKNIWTTFNGVTTGANPGNLYAGSFADLYDPNLYAYLCGWIKGGFGGVGYLSNNHENPWLMGLQEDEGDYLNSFSDVKRTGYVPFDGTYEDYGSRKDLFMPYHLSVSLAGNGKYIAFSNNLNNLKSNLISVLQTEYTTIAALNTAWGSTYDNFGTDGTQVTGETIATTMNSTQTVSTDSCAAPAAVPAAPTLTQGTGGSLTTGNAYSVAVGYVSSTGGETALSSVTTITLTGGNNAITVTSPAAETGMTGYNVYVITCAAPGPCPGVTNVGTNDAYNDVNVGTATPIALGVNEPILVNGHTGGHPPYADSTSVATVVFTTSLAGSVTVGDGELVSGTARNSGFFNSPTISSVVVPWSLNGISANSISFSWPVTGNDNGSGRGSQAISCPSGISSASDTGSGTDTSYNHTLVHIPDRASIQVSANGSVIAGDVPDGGNNSGAYLATGRIIGSSSVASAPMNYTTKAIKVTFAALPVSGNFPITANYWYGGWGVGHGLADEDGTCPAFSASCATVFGTSTDDIQVDGTVAFQTDMVTLLGNMAGYFSSHEKTQYRALMPHTPIVSDYALGGHGVPADPVVYQNYAPNVDAIASGGFDPSSTNSGGVGPQGIGPYQYVNNYVGDKPLLTWAGLPAVADSVMNIKGCNTTVASSGLFSANTQALRAAGYGQWITQLGVKGTYTGTDTFTGINTWQFADNYSECGDAYDGGNWGMVSAEDNPYDGVHDTTGTTPEYIGNNAFTPTPELHNYGDMINPVRTDIVNQENALLGAAPPPTFPIVPNKKSIIWGSIVTTQDSQSNVEVSRQHF